MNSVNKFEINGIKYDLDLSEFLTSNISDEEYARAYIDVDGHFLWGIRHDGSIEYSKGVPTPVRKYIEENFIPLSDQSYLTIKDTYKYSDELYISATIDSSSKLIEYTDADAYKHFPKQELFKTIDDKEYRSEITIDSDDRIISYRDSNGCKHEYNQHTQTASFDNLNLSDNNAMQIATALNNINYSTNINNHSEEDFIEIPIPRVCATVKLVVPKMPTSKTADISGTLIYNDKDGNYFEKAITLNSQGSSSMSYILPDGQQGNLSLDFEDCEIKFGSWVSQDSFHLKKYYIDAFRGQCVVGYHLMEQVYQSHKYGQKKPYEHILSNDSTTNSHGSFKKDFNTGALCHPDGFPIVIYVDRGNGEEYFGVYAWCLKKHRDNYYCNKSNPNNIILDGLITSGTLYGGTVQWNQFEIRNPKNLVDINGNEYDGESPKELSDTDETSKITKDNIIRFSGVSDALKNDNSKEKFEEYLLPTYFIDYYIVSEVLYNLDGFHKNWIWCTWDGLHWTPTLYDVDSIFGMQPIGTYVSEGSINYSLGESLTKCLKQLYDIEIKQRYAELRDAGIFTSENITNLLESWLKRIGYQNLKDDLEKYSQTPSYRDSMLNDDSWMIESYTWDKNNHDYDNTTTYNVNDYCYFVGYKAKALKQNTGVPVFKELYSNHPQGYGFYNSIQRVNNWLVSRFEYLDTLFEYNKN